MKLLFLAMRNMRANPWRSLALGSFALISAAIFVFANAFVYTISSNMKDALRNSLTGDIQIRSAATKETDMLSLKQKWNDLERMSETQTRSVSQYLAGQADVQTVRRVRTGALLSTGSRQEDALVIGIDPRAAQYEKALVLSEGRPLDPGRRDEIILSKQQAEKLKVGLGDEIELLVRPDGRTPRMAKATVVGIGEIKFFNMFGLFFAYTQLGTAQDLLGLKSDEVTDVIAFLPSGGQLKTFADNAAGQLGDGVKVTTRESMGGFITGGIQLYSALFYGFIIILLGIVGLLIVNMVFAIGIERRGEIGTLRAIGFSRASIVGVFVGEIGLVSTMFTALGVGLGAGAVLLLTRVALHPKAPLDFVMGSEFYMKFEPRQLVWPLVTISAFTALVAIIPAVQAASVRPVELMADK